MWPFKIYDDFSPVTGGIAAPGVKPCAGIVNNTPALVPTHIRSLQASSEVTRRHAALCCRIMSSQLDNILFTDGAKFTSNSNS